MEVYLLGSNDRAAVSCIHSLKNFDVNLNIVYHNRDCPSLKSKYLKKKCFISQNQRIEEVLIEIRKVVPIGALLIPVNDYYLEFALRCYEELSSDFHLSFGNKDATNRLIDKRALCDVAESLGFHVPKTHVISKFEDTNKLEDLGLEFPVIAKPVKSCIVTNGYIVSTSVKKIRCLQRLRMELAVNIENCAYLIQEYIPGFGSALNFYAVNGDIKAVFQYQRLHEPGFGGGSSYRQSVAIDQDLLAKARSLILEHDFTGLGMIEFRTSNVDGQHFLMEVNARPWGSMSLPIFAGVDFPAIVLRSHFGEAIEAHEYREDVYTRNIIKDVKWLIDSVITKRQFGMLYEPIAAVGKIISRREKFDNFYVADIGPFIKGFINVIIDFAQAVQKKTMANFLVLNQSLNRKKIAKEVRVLMNAKKVCFVCRGNIIRSKYAQLYFERVTGRDSYSSGTFYSENRNSPPSAVDVALMRGHDLNSFRSTTIHSLENLDEYVFLVMDGSNLYDLKCQFDAESVFLISAAAGEKGIVRDPYHTPFDHAGYQHAFENIERYINCISDSTS